MTGYPWATGDELLAADLNAAIANAGGGGGMSAGGVPKTDRSGTTVLGGAAQTLMPANPGRYGWSFQNKSGADMYFNDLGGTASPSDPASVYLPPGAYYETELGAASIAAVSLFCIATGATFAAAEW